MIDLNVEIMKKIIHEFVFILDRRLKSLPRDRLFAIENITYNNNDMHKNQIGISLNGTRVQYGNILITPVKNTRKAKKENMCELAKNIELNKQLNNLKHHNEARAKIVEDIHDAEYSRKELLLA